MRSDVLYGLPEKVCFCKKCVISNQRPSSSVEFKANKQTAKETIAFGEDGICSACQFTKVKDTKVDWAAREQELWDLCDKYRSKNGEYDCIVPGSGGKDSVFTAHILKYKFKMNPLTVTWAPHVYLDVGFKNMQSWIHSGFDNILFTPNGKVHRDLTRLAFENLCHPFQPFIVGQKHIAPKYSALYEIPLVFYGENQAEYGNKIQEDSMATMDPKFFMDDVDLTKIFLGGVSAEDLLVKHGLNKNDLLPYLPANKEKLQKVGTIVHYLGYYLKWDPQEMYYYAADHVGFRPAEERSIGTYSKYTEIDDLFVPLHFYTMFIKFGIGRATYDAAQEIRNNKITREEGAALVKRFDHEFPEKYLSQFLEYMGISRKRFDEVIDQARSPHLWEKANGEWRLKHAVWHEEHNLQTQS